MDSTGIYNVSDIEGVVQMKGNQTMKIRFILQDTDHHKDLELSGSDLPLVMETVELPGFPPGEEQRGFVVVDRQWLFSEDGTVVYIILQEMPEPE